MLRYYQDLIQEREIYIVNDISSLTHAHHISCLGCVIYCDYVKQLLNGKDKYDSLEYVMNKDYKKYYDDCVVDAYSRILNGDIVSLDKDSDMQLIHQRLVYGLHLLQKVMRKPLQKL